MERNSHVGQPLTRRYAHNFRVVRNIGNGAFGTVNECVYLPTAERCALKTIVVTEENHDKQMREAEVLRRIAHEPHPNLLRLDTAWLEEDIAALDILLGPSENEVHDL